MFTGIVEERGQVVRLEPAADSAILTVSGPLVVQDTVRGGSIAVDGCCLTVVDVDPASGIFTADVMAETLDKTALGRRRPGDDVNLERSVRADGRLDGHLVQGHVDGTGAVISREHGAHWDLVRVSLPPALTRYVAVKGSIAVDGVSLTVVDVDDESFTVALIPTTLRVTTLGIREPGDRVNLEVDVLAKYTERLLERRAADENARSTKSTEDIGVPSASAGAQVTA